MTQYKTIPIKFKLPSVPNFTLEESTHASYFRGTPRFIHDGLPLVSYIPKNCTILSVPHIKELGKIWEDWEFDLCVAMYSKDIYKYIDDYKISNNNCEVVILHTNEIILSYLEYQLLGKLFYDKFKKSFEIFFNEVQQEYLEETADNHLDILLSRKLDTEVDLETLIKLRVGYEQSR